MRGGLRADRAGSGRAAAAECGGLRGSGRGGGCVQLHASAAVGLGWAGPGRVGLGWRQSWQRSLPGPPPAKGTGKWRQRPGTKWRRWRPGGSGRLRRALGRGAAAPGAVLGAGAGPLWPLALASLLPWAAGRFSPPFWGAAGRRERCAGRNSEGNGRTDGRQRDNLKLPNLGCLGRAGAGWHASYFFVYCYVLNSLTLMFAIKGHLHKRI